MGSVMENFKQWCKLPNMHRTVDDTHIIILKSIAPFLEDYYYHKLGIYFIVVQVVDYNKRFFDTCGGLLGNVNELKILLCIIVLNIKICLILTKFWKVFPPYLLGGQCIPTNHMDNDAIQIRWTTSYLGFYSTIKKHKKQVCSGKCFLVSWRNFYRVRKMWITFQIHCWHVYLLFDE